MNGRRIVVHHCPRDFARPDLFAYGDTVFFDDCLWSQYRFILSNLDMLAGTRVVLGFSPGLARPKGLPPIEYVESAVAHEAVNAVERRPGDAFPDQIRAFMSVDEVLELVEESGAEIALHGCSHVRLESICSRVGRLAAFRRDVQLGAEMFRAMGIRTKMFVYPYAFSEDGYERVVNELGFTETYARPGAYRIAVEDILSERACVEDS